MQQLVLVPAPSLTYSPLWLISWEARGAVRSHSLTGEHMSGPICHWLLWEWHQRWPPDPGWRRNASSIGFHYEGGEGARTPDGYVENGENGKTGKGTKTCMWPFMFQFFAGGIYEIGIWPRNDVLVILRQSVFQMTVQEKLLEKKRGIILLTCKPPSRLASHCLLFNVPPDVHLLVWWALWETVLNVTVELQIRRQIVGTELSTRLSTGGIPAFHIDLSGT